MRQVAGLMLAAGLLWAGPATCYAGEREDALALIEAALKAHGGEEKMARTASSVRKDTGLLSAYGKDVPLADELTLSLPDRSHMAVEVGTDAFDVTARELAAAEREELFPKVTAVAPGFAEYQAKTSRVIPLFELQRG